jgi:hypothetical protein
MAELPPPVHDPGEVRELADQILARKAFEPEGRSILERMADWVAGLFDLDSGEAQAGSGGSTIGTFLLLAAAAVAIFFVVRALLRSGRVRRDRPESVLIDIDEHRTASEWTRAAAEHEAAGRWRDGLRCRFAALVTELVDRDVLPPTPGRTARELGRDLAAARPAASPPFDEAATLFERAWYGGEATGPSEAERFAALADRVRHDSAMEPVA